MRIGELAKCFGVNPKTIRYYEAMGLMPAPKRSDAGYRQYDETAAARLGFIQRAKQLGLSLDEIRRILAIHEQGNEPCDEVLALLDAERARIERRIRALQRRRQELSLLRRQWSDTARSHPHTSCLCPIIEEQTVVTSGPAEAKGWDLRLVSPRRVREVSPLDPPPEGKV